MVVVPLDHVAQRVSCSRNAAESGGPHQFGTSAMMRTPSGRPSRVCAAPRSSRARAVRSARSGARAGSRRAGPVGGKRIEALGMVRLVERELQIDGLPVERHVGILVPGRFTTESCACRNSFDRSAATGAAHARDDLVEERIVERPAARFGSGMSKCTLVHRAGCGAPPRAGRAVGECEAQRQVARRGVAAVARPRRHLRARRSA